MPRRRGRPKGSRDSKPRSRTTLSVSSPSALLDSFIKVESGDRSAPQQPHQFHFPSYLGGLDQPLSSTLSNTAPHAPLRDPDAKPWVPPPPALHKGQGQPPASLEPAANHYEPSDDSAPGRRHTALPRPRTEPSIAAPALSRDLGSAGRRPWPCADDTVPAGLPLPALLRVVPPDRWEPGQAAARCGVLGGGCGGGAYSEAGCSSAAAAARASSPELSAPLHPPLQAEIADEAADAVADPSAAGAPDESDPFHADWPYW